MVKVNFGEAQEAPQEALEMETEQQEVSSLDQAIQALQGGDTQGALQILTGMKQAQDAEMQGMAQEGSESPAQESIGSKMDKFFQKQK